MVVSPTANAQGVLCLELQTESSSLVDTDEDDECWSHATATISP